MIGSSVSAKICPFQSNLTAHLFISGAFPNSNHHLANKPSHINHPSPFRPTPIPPKNLILQFLAHLLLTLLITTTPEMTSRSTSSIPAEPVPYEVTFPPRGRNKRRKLDFKHDLLFALGEFLGTAMFLFLALGGTNFARPPSLPLHYVVCSC